MRIQLHTRKNSDVEEKKTRERRTEPCTKRPSTPFAPSSKRRESRKAGEDVGEKEASYAVGRNVKGLSCYGKWYDGSSKN